MSCDAVEYHGVTRSRFTCLQQSASQQLNLTLSGDSGTASDAPGDNSIAWNFNEANTTLTLQVTKSSYPCFLVKMKMDSFVASCP